MRIPTRGYVSHHVHLTLVVCSLCARIMELYTLVRTKNLLTKGQYVLPRFDSLFIKYFVPTRKDRTNNLEGRALRINTRIGVYEFLWEDNIQVCKKEIIMNRGELNVNEARELLKQFRVKVSLSTKYITHVHIIQFQGWISRSELPRLWRSVELLIIKLPIVYKHAKFHLDYVTLNKERSTFPCLYSIMLPSWS